MMLPKYTSVGCYPLFYFTTGDCLCADCAEKDNLSELNANINWEDPSLTCDECGTRIESAYAEGKAI